LWYQTDGTIKHCYWMKTLTPNLLFAIILLAIPFGYAAYIYPGLPSIIPTHFNLKGEADRFGGRDHIFLGPGIMAGAGLFTFFLLSNIKNLDPKRFKLEDDGMFKKLALFMVGFLSILGCIITYSATGFIVFIAVTAVMVIVPTLFSYRLFKNGNQIK